MKITTRSEHRCFGGRQGFYSMESAACAGEMRFSVFVPPAAQNGAKVPTLYYLAGLTCTEETFMIKAGAQQKAAELGLMLVTMDTSPRGARFPGDDAAWDFGLGAGFYLDATVAPWAQAYRMKTFVTVELRAAVEAHFAADPGRRGIFGHSMGGHGALTLALSRPDLYRSVSAFAPIVAPSQVPWGEKAFTGYLGPKGPAWDAHDAVRLIESGQRTGPILIDQGTADQFLQVQLQPERFVRACEAHGQPLELRVHEGYDHGYYFISTFVADHLRHHHTQLSKPA